MRVLHVPYSFPPDPAGGTEIYVEGLARHLERLGVATVVAAPGDRPRAYVHGGLHVHRFAGTGAGRDLRDLYGAGDGGAARGFRDVLERTDPDLVHLHAVSPAVSLRLVRETHRRGVPVALTYHHPAVLCQRGTLMRWGATPCDGTLRLRRCTRCVVHGLGVNRVASLALGSVPAGLGRLVGSARLAGGVWTGLRMTELVGLRHAAIRALLAEVDRVVVLCRWAKRMLLANGVPAEKISASTHGLGDTGPEAEGGVPRRRADGPLRLVALGRADPAKGLEVLVRVFRAWPGGPATLDVYSVAQDAAADAYLGRLRALAARDSRIRFLPAVPSAEVVALLRGYDALAVPSLCLETGPLVVLEAFAAGIPVVGSDLGGIAELVGHETDGLLVTPGSVAAWRHALEALTRDRRLLATLAAGVRPPRRMSEVAKEMASLYAAVLRRPGAGSAP
jgi:glycosyltransferase involved in cell wall biosynthesis